MNVSELNRPFKKNKDSTCLITKTRGASFQIQSHPKTPASYRNVGVNGYTNPFFLDQKNAAGEIVRARPGFADDVAENLSKEQKTNIVEKIKRYGGSIVNESDFFKRNIEPVLSFSELRHREPFYIHGRGELAKWGVNEAVDGLCVVPPNEGREAAVLMIVRADTLISIFENTMSQEAVVANSDLINLSLALHPERQNSVIDNSNMVDLIKSYLSSKQVDDSIVNGITDFKSARAALIPHSKSVHNDAIAAIKSAGYGADIKYDFLGGMREGDGTNVAIKKELSEEAGISLQEAKEIVTTTEQHSIYAGPVDDHRNTKSSVMVTEAKVFYLPDTLHVTGCDDAAVALFMPLSKVQKNVSVTHAPLASKLFENIVTVHPDYLLGRPSVIK